MIRLLLSILCVPFLALGQADLQKPFKECGINGSITVYDYQTKKWTFSNQTDAITPTLPASTFKVVNTLIALETGVIKDENELVKWHGKTDTTRYGYRPRIYRDLSLKQAFQMSAGWVYVVLATRIGKKRYRHYLSQCKYGNVDLSQSGDDFWNFGKFAISPKNQIEILQGVYEETLPFSKRSFRILKKIMVAEQGKNYVIRAKTGWTRDGGKDTGWWIGYVEKGKGNSTRVYFFATRLIKNRADKNKNFGKCRKTITRKVLKQMGIL
ncbi:penicillin-binding transpeptidase domain-containing protein [uncultured Microscilla sp.]|uniref:penicillin-binding transpeptidase domain-containing protein n=1 Tax=uncultured Microscilla sp. TaxID=432653 RepID=UPI002636F4FF|nr:penicillin-binding transpeptidase domain-containing protein [uncultured Microscilla sp.]